MSHIASISNDISRLKTSNYRTNRQNIGAVESIRKKLKKVEADDYDNNKTVIIHQPKKEIQKSKKNIIYSTITSENESDDISDDDEVSSEELIALNKNNVKLSSSRTYEIKMKSYKIYNKTEQIINNIIIKKTNSGISFTFDINNNAIKRDFYLLNYQIDREVLLATLDNKNRNYKITRKIDYDNLVFQNDLFIQFNIVDIHSKKIYLIQEFKIDLTKIVKNNPSVIKNNKKKSSSKYNTKQEKKKTNKNSAQDVRIKTNPSNDQVSVIKKSRNFVF